MSECVNTPFIAVEQIVGGFDGFDIFFVFGDANSSHEVYVMGDRFPDNYAASKAYNAYAETLGLFNEHDDPIYWDDLTELEHKAWVAAAKAAYKAEAWVLSDQ